MRVTPSRRLAGLILLTALVYLGGMTSLVIWLYIVAAMLCGLLVVGVAGPLLALRSVRVRSRGMRASGFAAPLAQDSGLAFEGDRLVLDLEGAGLDPDRLVVGPLLCADGGELAVSAVRAGADPARIEVVVDGCARGLHRISGVRVASGWPLGLVTAERTQRFEVDVAVHPRYACVPVLAGSGRGAAVDDPARRGGAGEIANIRAYQPQDDRRRIHWLTSARAGELMVVERTPETAEGVECRLSVGAGASAEAIEAGVRLVASVAASCTTERRAVRVALPGAGTVPAGWAAIRTALAGWRSGTAADRDPGMPWAAVEVTVDHGGLRLRVGDTTVPVDPGLAPEAYAAALEGLR
ncbi:MAG TPA: DUF58 domain-containing protein [Candidatus Dormibacteraeota bacterium]|nr:DUF58 domain-containing protein [Candidatus Dormibacteraeota bacterium]